jgi:hypothetical protein
VSDYLITGKKGNGKSIYAVGVIIDALKAGKRVATNLDLYLHKLNPRWTFTYTRLPDVPSIAEFEAIGRGQEGVVEDDNGVIVLDETSKIFNARDWQDKNRSAVLDWLVHSRKLGWDVYMIAQGSSQLDKTLRTNLLEYHVQVVRTDKWKLPFIGNIGKLIFGKPFTFPRMHIGTVRQGFQQGALIVDRKYYRGAPLYDLYDTQQLFLDANHPKAVGLHSVLSPMLTHGRYLAPRPSSLSQIMKKFISDFVSGHLDKTNLKLKERHPLAAWIMRQPEHLRIDYFRRFEAIGAFKRPVKSNVLQFPTSPRASAGHLRLVVSAK